MSTRTTALIAVVVVFACFLFLDSSTFWSETQPDHQPAVRPDSLDIRTVENQEPSSVSASEENSSVSPHSSSISAGLGVLSSSEWAHRVSCESFGEHGSLRLLEDEAVFSGMHFCELTDVIINGRTLLWKASGDIAGGALQLYLNLSTGNQNTNKRRRSAKRRNFPFSLFGKRFSTVISPDAPPAADVTVSTAVFLPTSYEFSHPTHALESLGALTQKFIVSARQQQQQQPLIIDRVILPQRKGSTSPECLQHQAISCVLSQSQQQQQDSRSDSIKVVKFLGVGNEILHVKRLLVPGSVYNIFSSPAQASAFMQAFAVCQRREEMNDLQRASNNTQKRVVFLRRDPQRTRRLLGLESFVEHNLRPRLLASASMNSVELLFVDPHLQKRHSVRAVQPVLNDADVIVGMHGADLTLMLLALRQHGKNGSSSAFHRKAVTVVELFPFGWAGDPRFGSLAKLLSFEHIAVNCALLECTQKDKVAPLLAARGISFLDSTGFTWLNGMAPVFPQVGMAGEHNCHGCSTSLVHQLGEEAWTALRDTDVSLAGKMTDALAEVIVASLSTKT